MNRRRAKSTVKPYRDPFMDQLPAILNQIRRDQQQFSLDINSLTPEQIIKAIIIDTSKEPCFVCDKPAATVETFFVPEELARFNQRVIFYTLCGPCKLDITTHIKVTWKLVDHILNENSRMGV